MATGWILSTTRKKSAANLLKHNIDFERAKAIWNGPIVEAEIKDSIKRFGEMRYLVLGKIDLRQMTAVVSSRGLKVRLISVRDCNEKESELYAHSIANAKAKI